MYEPTSVGSIQAISGSYVNTWKINEHIGHSGGATPVPIPNTEDKPARVCGVYCGTRVHGNPQTLMCSFYFSEKYHGSDSFAIQTLEY